MQYTKKINNGKTEYVRPKDYKPLRKNRNDWYFADKKTAICEQVYEIGQKYNKSINEPTGRARHRIKNPIQLIKLYYWIFLTGAKPYQAFSKPITLQIIHEQQRDYVNIMHTSLRCKNIRKEIVICMPIIDESEQMMWSFITDGGTETELEKAFGSKGWKSTKSGNINALFKKNFKTDLESQDKKSHKNQGISPQILRYMRFKNLALEHDVRYEVLSTWFGCDIKKMMAKHQDLKAGLDAKEQYKSLQKQNLFGNYRIGLNMNFGL